MTIMVEANINESIGRNRNAIIIAVTIVVLAIILMYFRDRQQKRYLELQQLEGQVEVWEEWGLPQQNMQPNKVPGKKGRIL